MSVRVLPQNITSYDLLKTFAVVIMVIDHIGFYFFPEELWLRAVGRIGFPIWFFLVGHASGRGVPVKLWGSALILLFANIIVGMPLFPLNALVTIIIIRVFIDLIVNPCLKNKLYLYGICTALVILIIPTNFITEYGTLALITAMYGYFVRHKKEINNDSFVMKFMIFSFFAFVVFQMISYGFSIEQFTLMAAGTLAVRLYLFYFKPNEYPTLTKKLPATMIYIFRLCGRKTLEIYVIHLIIFKFAAIFLGFDGYGLFEFELIDYSMLDMM